jgi:hypothetical protein
LEDHARRVLDGVDPMTGSAADGAWPGELHDPVPTSTSFTSNEAYAQAEAAAHRSPEFAKQAAAGKSTIYVKQLTLSDALGPQYLDHVDGVTLKDPAASLSRADLTDGRVFAIYDLRDGDYVLRTMYPKPVR